MSLPAEFYRFFPKLSNRAVVKCKQGLLIIFKRQNWLICSMCFCTREQSSLPNEIMQAFIPRIGDGWSALGEYDSQSYTFLKAGDTFPKNSGTRNSNPSQAFTFLRMNSTLSGNWFWQRSTLSKGTYLISISSISREVLREAHFLTILVMGDYSSKAPEMAAILYFIQRLFKVQPNRCTHMINPALIAQKRQNRTKLKEDQHILRVLKSYCSRQMQKQLTFQLILMSTGEIELDKIDYRRKLGTRKLFFEGKPASYYELKCGQISCALSLCFLIVIIFFWVCVAFFFWSDRATTDGLVITWSIVLIVFIPIFTGLTYYCSYNKRQIEERLIKEALQKQMDKKGKHEHVESGKDLSGEKLNEDHRL